MSVDLSGEITAIATAVLAFFAIVTAVFAFLAYRKQSGEVRAIEQQVKDQQEVTKQQTELLGIQAAQLELQRRQFDKQLAERRRSQASRVFIWSDIGPDPRRTDEQIDKGVPWREGVTAHIRNTSEQPIYDLMVSWQKGTAPWDAPFPMSVLMPGQQEDLTHVFPDDLPPTVNVSLFSAVVRFRDASGVRWLLRPDGHLAEEPATAVSAPH